MVTGKVKHNKANDTKYIYLSKTCGLPDGQEVEIRAKGIGVYDKEALDRYYDLNKNMLADLKSQIFELRKKTWEDGYFELCEAVGKASGLGKLEYDEVYYFEHGEYTFELGGDIDGGELGDFTFKYDDETYEDKLKERNLTDEQIKKDINELAIVSMLQKKGEDALDKYTREEDALFKKFGFERIDHPAHYDYLSCLFSNGVVNVYYNGEELMYGKMLKVTTVNDLIRMSTSEVLAEPTIEF